MNGKTFKRIAGDYSLKGAARDSDRDGVMNIADCAPYNKSKQGIVHAIKSRYKEEREAMKHRAAAKKIIRKKARAAYLRAREKEEIAYAAEKAAYERKRKVAYIKRGGALGAVKVAARSIEVATRPPRKKARKKRPSILDIDIGL